MAIFIGSIVAIADPETLECISIEVLDFKKAVDSGALQGAWTRLLPFIEWQPILHVPPVVPEAFPDTDDFPHDLARDVQRELAAV